jgi:molecular chaperone GrpE
VASDDNTEERSGQKTPVQIPELSEIDMLSARVAELEKSVGQYKDQLLRKAAEFENYKKRVENDYASIVKFSNEDLILKLLPVVDDFERSFRMTRGAGDEQDSPTRASEGSLRRGMELIYEKLKRILEAQGARPFDSLGKPFDPHLHDALLQVPRSDVPPHTVIEEVDKGYMLNDKVLRHAKVVVAADQPALDDPDGRGGESGGDA